MLLSDRPVICKRGSLLLLAVHKEASSYPGDFRRRGQENGRASAGLEALHNGAKNPGHDRKKPTRFLRELGLDRSRMNTVDGNARSIETPSQFVREKHLPDLRQSIRGKLAVALLALEVVPKTRWKRWKLLSPRLQCALLRIGGAGPGPDWLTGTVRDD